MTSQQISDNQVGELVPEKKPRPGRKPAAKAWDDLDALPDLSDLVPEPASVPVPGNEHVPPVHRAVPGYPDVESDPDLKARRDTHAKLVEQWRSARDSRDQAFAKYKLNPGEYAPAKLDAMCAKLIAAGQSVEDVEFLEQLHRTEARLAGAVAIAAKEIRPALESAIRRLNSAVAGKLVPTSRELQLAKIAWIKAAAAHRAATEAHRQAGFSAPAPLHVWGGAPPLGGEDAKRHFKEYLDAGVLTLDVLSELDGLPPVW